MKVGFISLVQMGMAMAANLFEAGHKVTVWNRSLNRGEPPKRSDAIRDHM